MSELKKIDHSAKALSTLKSQVPIVFEQHLGSKISDDLQKISTEKSASEILNIKKEQATMHESKSFNRNPANHRLYHAPMEALIEDKNEKDKGVADIIKDHKRKHDDDEDPPARPNQVKKIKRRRNKESESSKKPYSTKETSKGKAPSEGSKTSKFDSAKEPVKEPIAEVVMDDAGEDVVRNDDQPQDTFEPKTAKNPNPEWILSHLMISRTLLLTSLNKLDWNNLEGDHYPFDMSKPLPLQGHPSHLTIAADYLLNNAKNLKSSNLERTYTTTITKTKEALYEIVVIEYMSVSVKKLHGYGHLEEVVVKRANRQLCKFKE
nr:hypothetical protein [Tanacetum cinerariifolium]